MPRPQCDLKEILSPKLNSLEQISKLEKVSFYWIPFCCSCITLTFVVLIRNAPTLRAYPIKFWPLA